MSQLKHTEIHSKNWTLPLSSFYFHGDDFAVCSQHEDNDSDTANDRTSKRSQPTSSSDTRSSNMRTLPQFGQGKTKEEGSKRSGGSANAITSSPYTTHTVAAARKLKVLMHTICMTAKTTQARSSDDDAVEGGDDQCLYRTARSA